MGHPDQRTGVAQRGDRVGIAAVVEGLERVDVEPLARMPPKAEGHQGVFASDGDHRAVRVTRASHAARVGRIADRLVGEAFEREVASLCGLVGNWLQMAYEGPDLTAFGAFDYDTVWQWQSRVVQDSWAARLNTNALGTPVGWEIPCDSLGFVAVLDVIDQDIAFDDPVGTLLMNLAIPDEIICDGWAYYEGVAGIAGVLVRLEVVGATPYCG